MTQDADPQPTTQELLAQAQGNATAFVLTTIAYLKERGLPVDDYLEYFGRQFAPGWEELGTRPVKEVARTVANNAVSVGCSVGSMSGDETRAEVLITGWLDADTISETLGLERGDSDAVWNSFYPIMERLGINYTWRREDGMVRVIFERCRD